MTERVPLLRKVTQPNGQTSELTIEQALRDTNLLGSALGEVSSWSNWLTVLKAAFGQELTASELAIFEQVAGERPVPTSRVRELWAIVGRRGGKSRIAAAVAIYIACFCKIGTALPMVRSVTSWSLQHQEIRHGSCSSTALPSSNNHRSCAKSCCQSLQARSAYEAISSSVSTPTHSEMSEEERSSPASSTSVQFLALRRQCQPRPGNLSRGRPALITPHGTGMLCQYQYALPQDRSRVLEMARVLRCG